MCRGGGGRPETKHDLVGAAHTAGHCFPLGARPWLLLGSVAQLGAGDRGSCCPWWIQSSSGGSRMPGKLQGTQELPCCSPRGMQVAWAGTKRVRILGPAVKSGCVWVPGECESPAGTDAGMPQAPHQHEQSVGLVPFSFHLSHLYPFSSH